MGQFIKVNKTAGLILLLILVYGSSRLSAQCSNWNINISLDSATCAANGKMEISITGADAPNLDSFHYSLTPLFTGGNVIYQSTMPVLENLKPGSYTVTVEALCNDQPVSQSLNVRVPGVYKEISVAVSSARASLKNCSTGRIKAEMKWGNLPYRITLTSFPAGYSGTEYFVTSDSSFIIDSLPAGSYAVSITDACSTTPAVQSLLVGELPALLPEHTFERLISLNSCNSFATYCYVDGSDFPGYTGDDSPFFYSVSLDGEAKLPYKRALSSVAGYDTLALPAGSTIKDYYGKTITYYIKSECQDEISFTTTIESPTFSYSLFKTCDNNFYLGSSFAFDELICNPLTLEFQNKETGEALSQTLTYNATVGVKTGMFPFGTYDFTVTTADGALLYRDTSFRVLPPDTLNPYSIQISRPLDAYYGKSGIGGFIITSNYENFHSGTTIALISPVTSSFSPPSDNVNYITIEKKADNSFFGAGYYVFRVTDPCRGRSYDLPVYLGEEDLTWFNWTYTMERTCFGMKVTPSGTVTGFGADGWGGRYKVVSGTNTYPTANFNEHESVLFPFAGTYRIAMGAYFSGVRDYGENTKTITFEDSPLRVRNDSTLGWVCPGDPDNNGHIKIRATDGNSGNRHFLYKLAEDGKGETGPYIDSGYSGNFSSGDGYQLIRNHSYQVKIIDDCNASIVQRVTILDFANYQVVTADKPLFCVNDDVHLIAFNLPTTAKTYSWTGPNNFTSTSQDIMLVKVRPAQEGMYHVVINSDMCARPIEGEVDIQLAPYITYCYSAVTDTSVNPYTYGMLGNWHPSRSYTYYGARKQSVTTAATNIRSDGTFDDFSAFWKQQTKGWARNPNCDTTAWVWKAESTIFNKKGFELENRDPLGRYNAGLYGYDNTVPVAIVQNSRYRDAAFDGFEDYGFITSKCSDDAGCPADRRFDFSSYISRIDSTQHHTGRFSLRLDAHDTIQMKVPVVEEDSAISPPVFNIGSSPCTPYDVLRSVKANNTILLPSFSPVAGNKMFFSVWIKEEEDCQCVTYTNNKITLFVAGETRITIEVQSTGNIIDGWQRYEQVVSLPQGSTGLSVVMVATGSSSVYIDDLRFHPYNASMKSFVYDPQNLRLMAELDENNYATFYEYDDDGMLTRVKKETERGIKTIKELRNGLIKEEDEDNTSLP